MIRSVRSLRATALAAALPLLLLAACGRSTAEDPATDDDQQGEDGSDELSGELTVFAAASLHDVFADIADVLDEEHPDVEVTFSFAGSSDLVAQIDAGAPADVLATANETTMDDAVAGDLIDGEPELFARNVLTLVTPSDNPAGVAGLDESLDDADLVICAPQVPCGSATTSLSELTGVTFEPVSEEGSVTDVLAKVTSGQADAGLVYETDAAAAGDEVDVIDIPAAEDIVNNYPVAVVSDTDVPELAELWLTVLDSDEATQILSDAGFRLP